MKRVRKILWRLLLLGFVMGNAMVCMHAWRFTHFTNAGKVTPNAAALSFSQKVRVLFLGVNVPRPEHQRQPEELGMETAQDLKIDMGEDRQIGGWLIETENAKGVALLLHGYASTRDAMLESATFFHAEGYHVLLIDFRGSGGSFGNKTSLGYREAEEVAAACKQIEERFPELPVVIHGASMGAVAALHASHLGTINPNGMILVAPFHSFLGTVGNRFRDMGLPAFPGAHILVFWGSVQAGMNGYRFNPARYAAALDCPVLHMRGADDTNVTHEDFEAINHAIPERLLTTHEIKGQGHTSLSASAKDEWQRVVRRWLRERERSGF